MNSWHLDANFYAIRNFLQKKIISTLQHADHWWQPMPRNQEAEEEEFSERNCNCTFFLHRENKAMICVCCLSRLHHTAECSSDVCQQPPPFHLYFPHNSRKRSSFSQYVLYLLSSISLSRYSATTTANTPLTIKPQLELF